MDIDKEITLILVIGWVLVIALALGYSIKLISDSLTLANQPVKFGLTSLTISVKSAEELLVGLVWFVLSTLALALGIDLIIKVFYEKD